MWVVRAGGGIAWQRGQRSTVAGCADQAATITSALTHARLPTAAAPAPAPDCSIDCSRSKVYPPHHSFPHPAPSAFKVYVYELPTRISYDVSPQTGFQGWFGQDRGGIYQAAQKVSKACLRCSWPAAALALCSRRLLALACRGCRVARRALPACAAAATAPLRVTPPPPAWPPICSQFLAQLLVNPVRTEDPSEAHLFFLPSYGLTYTGGCLRLVSPAGEGARVV